VISFDFNFSLLKKYICFSTCYKIFINFFNAKVFRAVQQPFVLDLPTDMSFFFK